jgi:hypothetical protein
MNGFDGRGILTDHVGGFPFNVITEVRGGVISQSDDFDGCGPFRLGLEFILQGLGIRITLAWFPIIIVGNSIYIFSINIFM